MRPNVDIPWSVHGQLKEYAQNEEITIEDAYIETLKTGLSTMPTPVHTETDLDQFDTTQYPFGPRLVPLSNDEGRDINDICTFFPRFGYPSQPVTFKTYWRNIDVDDLEESLIRLFKLIEHPYQDWFTFHQLGGAWVGSGVENFLHMLRTAPDRLDEADFQTYKSGFAVYLVEIDESEFIALRLEIGRGGKLDELTVGFLTDGHPVNGVTYSKYIAQFGLSKLSHGRDRELRGISVHPDDVIEVAVVDRILKSSHHEDEPWVSGLIIENPLQNHRDLYEKLYKESPEEYRDDPGFRNQIEQLVSYDQAYVQLKDHHPESEDHSYDLIAISATELTPIFDRNSIWNLSISANW